MLQYLAITCMFLSIVLLYFSARSYKSSIYLGVYFFIVGFYGFNQYVILGSSTVFFTSIIVTNFTFLLYLMGPMFYFYIRSVLTNNSKLQKIDFLHFIPSLTYLFCSIPYITTPYDYKVELAKRIISNPSFLVNYKFTILSDWFTIPGVYYTRPFLVLFYVILSGILILQYKKTNIKLKTQKLDRSLKYWIITFFIFQFLLALSHLLFLIKGFDIKSQIVHFSIYTYYYFSGLCLIGLIISPFFYPRILYGMSFSKLENSNCLIQNQDIHAKLAGNKYISFDEEYLNSLSLKIDESMKNEKLFLHKDINLARLSVELNIPVHHLSYYFSGIKKISFNDYRNMLRVEYAKELILDKKNEVMTLEAIALLCGFSDRNSFTTAFKKIEGTTPKLFASRCSKYV